MVKLVDTLLLRSSARASQFESKFTSLTTYIILGSRCTSNLLSFTSIPRYHLQYIREARSNTLDTHEEAHYSTCMLLAGILLKMGAYGLIRINMELLAHAHSRLSPCSFRAVKNVEGVGWAVGQI
ncbi:hypothetical protein KSP40_PGU001895 [Platanthera guangdongensis]|uniref:Uncharacterized protein n=1 Tax=Platanthera guangdongensis TaxID=2320717 RepID=A0ABR2M7F6_9ASPA